MKKILTLIITVLLSVFFVACGKNAQNYIDEGMAFITEENYEEAVIAFTSAIEIEEKSIAAYKGRAQAYAAMNQYENAVNDYLTVIEIDPDDQEAYDNAIDLYLKQEDEVNALTYIQQKEDKFGNNSISPEQQIIIDREESLQKLEVVLASGNRNDLLELTQDEEYISSISANQDFIEELKKTPVIRKVGDKFIGLYVLEETDIILYYYGSMSSNNLRQGFGTFQYIGYSPNNGHALHDIYLGNWGSDVPQGQYTYTLYDFVTEDEFIIEGNVVDGLWNGEVTETFHYHYIETFKNGELQNAFSQVDENGRMMYAFAYVPELGGYMMTTDENSGKTYGVECFADASFYIVGWGG